MSDETAPPPAPASPNRPAAGRSSDLWLPFSFATAIVAVVIYVSTDPTCKATPIRSPRSAAWARRQPATPWMLSPGIWPPPCSRSAAPSSVSACSPPSLAGGAVPTACRPPSPCSPCSPARGRAGGTCSAPDEHEAEFLEWLSLAVRRRTRLGRRPGPAALPYLYNDGDTDEYQDVDDEYEPLDLTGAGLG